MPTRFLSLALIAPLLAGSPSAAPPPAVTDDLSLEELLARYKAERERLFESYRGIVNALVADIEGAYEKRKKKDLAKFRASLVELGPAVAPLLVGQLDAGLDGSDAQKGRAREIALVLSELSTRAVTKQLLQMLDQAGREGHRNALTVLAHSDDPERVGPVLRARFASAEGSDKGRLLAAIATLGGPRNEAFLGEVLTDKDPQVVKLSIEALSLARTDSAAPRILMLVQAPLAAAPHARALVAYYRACPQVIDDEHCDALLTLAESLLGKPDDAVLVLGLLADSHDEWGSKLKRRLKDLADDAGPKVAQAALIALARNGDRVAKKKLLEPLDDRLDDNELLPSAWQSRADMRYAIGDYKNAIKDYTQSLRLGEDFGRPQPDIYIGLARCYALLGKEKDASEWLDKAPISISQLRALAQDPVFAELVASSKYRRVFHLEDD